MSTQKKQVRVLTLAAAAMAVIVAACGGRAATPAAPAPTAEQPKATEAPAAPAATEAPKATEAPAATVAPAAGAISREETLILDIDGGRVVAPELWNPYVPGNRRDHGFHQSMIEPLFILNYMTGKLDPWLGESMSSNATSDVWTLKLNKNAAWSDGVPLTSDDVVFTINMLKDHKELGDSASMTEWVKDVKKVDDQTVEFTLNKPNPRFQLDNFSVKIWGGINISPKHIWENQDPLTFKNYDPAKGWPIYSGPYKLSKISETEFEYLRDDNWWGAKSGFKPLPAPKKLIWTWAGPPENRVALMADHKLDSLMDITLGAFTALKAKNPNVIAWYKDLPYAVLDPCPRNFEFNTTQAPWDDPQMRWAVNYAFDRDEIVKIAYEGSTSKSKMPFPAYDPMLRFQKLLEDKGLYDKYPLWTHDPEQSKKIIESKGYTLGSDGYYAKDGKQLSMLITTHAAFIEKQRIADVMVEELQKVGINATHKNEEGDLWDTNWRTGKFETRMAWHSCGSVNEPWATLDTLNEKWIKPVGERADSNPWRWKNDDFSKAVDQMGTLPLGDPKVDELFVQAMEQYLKDLPNIPITQAKKLIPFDTTYWTNWPSDDNKYAPSWTWWQSTYEILVAIKPVGK